jgi:hypothetical protein
MSRPHCVRPAKTTSHLLAGGPGYRWAPRAAPGVRDFAIWKTANTTPAAVPCHRSKSPRCPVQGQRSHSRYQVVMVALVAPLDTFNQPTHHQGHRLQTNQPPSSKPASHAPMPLLFSFLPDHNTPSFPDENHLSFLLATPGPQAAPCHPAGKLVTHRQSGDPKEPKIAETALPTNSSRPAEILGLIYPTVRRLPRCRSLRNAIARMP